MGTDPGLVARLANRVWSSPPRLGAVRLVCVDGPAGSGKTTLAGWLGLALGAQVVHVDDLLEGWDGLATFWPRLEAQVLAPLAAGRPGRYRRYDWVEGRFADWCDVPVADVLVLEGCSSARRAVDAVAVLRVWVEATAEVRLDRGLRRDGEAMRPRWLEWMAAEATHFAVESTRERADVRVDTTVSEPPGGELGPVPPDAWFDREPLEVAPDLLGAYLTTDGHGGRVTVRLTEVEAYGGAQDPASHAFRGFSRRNAVMFGEPGRLYVYRHLGLHTCLNVVCGPGLSAGAVLLRAGEVVEGGELARDRRTRTSVVVTDVDLARGPARLAVAVGLDLTANGAGVADPGGAVVVHLGRAGRPTGTVATGPRVGVSGPGADGGRFPWRFWLTGEPTVSAYRAAPRRPRARQTGPASRAPAPE